MRILLHIALWISGLFLLGLVGPAKADTTAVADITHVCENWAVPTGYVITRIEPSSPNCQGVAEYTVQPPVDGVTVCYNSPVPSPYVAVSISPSSACGRFQQSVLRIAASGMVVCQTSPIPDGFGVTSAFASNGTCADARRYQITSAAAGLAICSFSVQPSGYVVAHVDSSPNCLGSRAFVLATAYDGVSACGVISRVPDGYVVTEGYATNQCVDGSWIGDYWTYRKAYDGVQVCPYSPVPSGYYIVGSVTGMNCKSANGSGYLLRRL